jgi:hypothetical protein
MYEEASRVEQRDPEIFSVLGVLYNLSREYEMAEAAFARAVEVGTSHFHSPSHTHTFSHSLSLSHSLFLSFFLSFSFLYLCIKLVNSWIPRITVYGTSSVPRKPTLPQLTEARKPSLAIGRHMFLVSFFLSPSFFLPLSISITSSLQKSSRTETHIHSSVGEYGNKVSLSVAVLSPLILKIFSQLLQSRHV